MKSPRMKEYQNKETYRPSKKKKHGSLISIKEAHEERYHAYRYIIPISDGENAEDNKKNEKSSEESSLEELFHEKENERPITLEDIIEHVKKNDFKNPYSSETDKKIISMNLFDNYCNEINTNKDLDKKSGARVYYVSPSQLPSGRGWRALGMYDPSTHTIYIANNLSPQEERFVYHHEVAHALGIKSEAQADAYAITQVGYAISGRENIYRLAA